MVNTDLLRSKIVERRTNIAAIATKMGVDKATLYRRIADSESFTIGEVKKLVQILKLTAAEAITIFF